ncbi:MAG: hypothetical protein HOV81_05190 [Kofleriaceae bacterium]|nr:hypothetical protein [Kofleriaceae bacterium]
MRAASVLVVIAACGPGSRDSSIGIDAATQVDASPEPDAAWFETRYPSGAIAGAHRVVWTQQGEPCTLPLRCFGPAGPTLSMRDFSTGVVTTLFQDSKGAEALAGDEDEVFLVLTGLETNIQQQYVARFRPGISTAPEPMSAPGGHITLLFVDSTYVYWRVENTAAVVRASRSGDGSDATILSMGGFVPSFSFNGYYWTDRVRVPIAGGPVEVLSSIDVSFPIATPDGIYAAKAVDDTTWSIGVLGTDDVYRPVVTDIPKEKRPYVLTVDGGELFWTTLSSGLYHARAGDSTFSTVLQNMPPFEPFAVTADEILYNFTRNGYQTAPR